MTTTTNRIDQLAQDALDMATDYGTRTWVGGAAPMTPNAYGGYDFRHGDMTIRLADDDGTVVLYVFTGGRAMLLSEKATFSAGLAHLAGAYIAEALR